jgi:hypothetical protein
VLCVPYSYEETEEILKDKLRTQEWIPRITLTSGKHTIATLAQIIRNILVSFKVKTYVGKNLHTRNKNADFCYMKAPSLVQIYRPIIAVQ